MYQFGRHPTVVFGSYSEIVPGVRSAFHSSIHPHLEEHMDAQSQTIVWGVCVLCSNAPTTSLKIGVTVANKNKEKIKKAATAYEKTGQSDFFAEHS